MEGQEPFYNCTFSCTERSEGFSGSWGSLQSLPPINLWGILLLTVAPQHLQQWDHFEYFFLIAEKDFSNELFLVPHTQTWTELFWLELEYRTRSPATHHQEYVKTTSGSNCTKLSACPACSACSWPQPHAPPFLPHTLLGQCKLDTSP